LAQALVYFDVPPSARSFSLQFSKDGPLFPVTRLVDLPALDANQLQQ
jgi:hypothetical protein